MRLVAYIDSGSGSLILQAMAGGVAGIAVAARLYWRRLKRFFGRGGPEEPELTQANADADDQRPPELASETVVGRADS